MTTQFDFAMDFEPRISREVNPLGRVQYTVQWFSRSGSRPPEPCSWSFKKLRQAEKFIAHRQKRILERTFTGSV